jgi:ATP-binding cassette subfamily C protein
LRGRTDVTAVWRDCLGFAIAVARFTGARGILASLLVMLGAIAESIGVIMLVPLLGTLFHGASGNGGALTAGWIGRFASGLAPFDRLSLILAVFAAVMGLRALVLWKRDTMLGGLQIAFVEAQRALIARRLASAQWPVLVRLGHGRVTHLMGGDIQRCGTGVYFLLQSAAAVVMVLAQAVLAFALAPLLASLALALILLCVLALSGLLRQSQDVGKIVTDTNLSLMIGIGRFLGGMKMAMSENLQHRFVAAFEQDLDRSARWQRKFVSQQALTRGLWGFLAGCVAGITTLVGYGVLHLPAPILLAILVLLARISGPVAQIHTGLQQIAYSLPAWNAVRTMERELAVAEKVQDGSADPARSGPAGTIKLQAVRHLHHDTAGAEAGIRHLTVVLKPGEMVGVTGPSGAGKTTFADLLTGLLLPQSGSILVNDMALTEDGARQLRDRIAYVTQDPVLFNDTIRRNLAWVAPEADDASLMEAIAVAGAAPLIARLPDGLETIVGEGGTLISGGERQRLALARALLRKPDLLILDEATSAIDIAGEREVLLRLRALDPRPTIVLIAHRNESLVACDRILRFAGGTIESDTMVDVTARAERNQAFQG